MPEDAAKQVPLAYEDDFQEKLLSASEISSLSSSVSSLSPPPPTIPMRDISLIERRGLHIDGLKIDDTKEHSSTEFLDGDALDAHATNLISANLRRNSMALPSGLDMVDSEAIQRPHIDDKIRKSKSNGVSISDVNEIVNIGNECSETESDDDVPKYRSSNISAHHEYTTNKKVTIGDVSPFIVGILQFNKHKGSTISRSGNVIIREYKSTKKPDCDNRNSENCDGVPKETCDCGDEDSFQLLDTVTTYLESADSIVVVRSCEGAMILTSLPSLNNGMCSAIRSSLNAFSVKISERLSFLCRQIPEDMDTGEIEDSVVSWGLNPRDGNASQFIGVKQLTEFLCWLDYANCLSNECAELSTYLGPNVRVNLLEDAIEPSLLDSNAFFMLVLASKIIRQIDSKQFSDDGYNDGTKSAISEEVAADHNDSANRVSVYGNRIGSVNAGATIKIPVAAHSTQNSVSLVSVYGSRIGSSKTNASVKGIPSGQRGIDEFFGKTKTVSSTAGSTPASKNVKDTAGPKVYTVEPFQSPFLTNWVTHASLVIETDMMAAIDDPSIDLNNYNRSFKKNNFYNKIHHPSIQCPYDKFCFFNGIVPRSIESLGDHIEKFHKSERRKGAMPDIILPFSKTNIQKYVQSPCNGRYHIYGARSIRKDELLRYSLEETLFMDDLSRYLLDRTPVRIDYQKASDFFAVFGDSAFEEMIERAGESKMNAICKATIQYVDIGGDIPGDRHAYYCMRSDSLKKAYAGSTEDVFPTRHAGHRQDKNLSTLLAAPDLKVAVFAYGSKQAMGTQYHIIKVDLEAVVCCLFHMRNKYEFLNRYYDRAILNQKQRRK